MQNIVQKTVHINLEEKIVYNITVEDCHEYFANNVLVHNCDALANCIWAVTRNQVPAVTLTWV